jgi:uncharacterized Zn finger protein
MSAPKITEAMIRSLSTAQSFSRGEDYYHSGAVIDLQKRGNTLLAQVEGSDYEPYEVTVELETGAVAGVDWPAVKPELLDQLAKAQNVYGAIDIYLHEGLVDQAVQAINQGTYWGYETLERVTEAAWQSHPEWAIRHCQQQAERIMDSGKSQRYYYALRWLEWAGKAYRTAGREDDWRAYLESLIQKHSRKYALRPGLEALRKSLG